MAMTLKKLVDATIFPVERTYEHLKWIEAPISKMSLKESSFNFEQGL